MRYLEARGDLHRQGAGAAQRAADLRTAPLAPGERLDDRIAQAKAAEAEAATRRLALQPDGAARVLAAARQTLIGRGQRRLATLAQNAPTIDVLHRRVDAQRLADQLRPQNQNQAKQQRDRGLDR